MLWKSGRPRIHFSFLRLCIPNSRQIHVLEDCSVHYEKSIWVPLFWKLYDGISIVIVGATPIIACLRYFQRCLRLLPTISLKHFLQLLPFWKIGFYFLSLCNIIPCQCYCGKNLFKEVKQRKFQLIIRIKNFQQWSSLEKTLMSWNPTKSEYSSNHINTAAIHWFNTIVAQIKLKLFNIPFGFIANFHNLRKCQAVTYTAVTHIRHLKPNHVYILAPEFS